MIDHTPLDAFIFGNRATALAPGEIVTEILIPKASCDGRSSFEKLGARRYLVISIAMVAARIATDHQGKILAAAISVGACSTMARRLFGLEARLIGRLATTESLADIGAEDVTTLSPIDDVRAPASYRVDAAVELVRRALRIVFVWEPKFFII